MSNSFIYEFTGEAAKKISAISLVVAHEENVTLPHVRNEASNLQTTMDVLVVNQSNCELPNDIVDITLVPDVQFISCLRIDYCVITLKNTDAIRTALCAGETVLKLNIFRTPGCVSVCQ